MQRSDGDQLGCQPKDHMPEVSSTALAGLINPGRMQESSQLLCHVEENPFFT